MKRVEAPCPQCGAMVEFKVSSSLVTICEFCQTVVARGDKRLEDHGKVGLVVPLASPIHLDATSVYRGKKFHVVGHIQYEHAGGGIWNEWYVSFPGNRWGWLAEAQGKFYLLAPKKAEGGVTWPSFEQHRVGERLQIRGLERLTVVETGTATVAAAEGEMPFLVRPRQSHQYVDLAGPDNTFATLEYSDSGDVTLYAGREVTLADLGLAPVDAADDSQTLVIAALAVACPQCGGSLELQAPDQTERVICPYCESLLDADHGTLKYLSTLKSGKRAQPLIPLGSKGHLRGEDYVVIGFMLRSVTFDMTYYWTEYLLYNPKLGFRWLVHSDDHWSFVKPLSAGDLDMAQRLVVYRGRSFKLFQRAAARVRYVLGEFYWKVQVNEVVEASDYIAPPLMISIERTTFNGKGKDKAKDKKGSEEITCSLGTYLPHEEVEAAFRIKNLRRGWGVAPNQPSPVHLPPLILCWIGFGLILLLIQLLASAGLSAGTVDGSWFWIMLIALSVIPLAAMFYSHSFEQTRWKDSEFNPYSDD